MVGNTPVKTSNGNIIVEEFCVLQQSRFILLVLSLFPIIPIYVGMDKLMLSPRVKTVLEYVVLALILFGIAVYSISSKYIFDTKLKQIRKERRFLFSKSVTTICHFNAVRMLGVSACIKQERKRHRQYIYKTFDILIVFPGKPDELITLVKQVTITCTLKPEEIEKIYFIIKEAIDCKKCFPLTEHRSIGIVKVGNVYDYIQTPTQIEFI